MKTEQTYSNHVRWYPPFHFVLAPLMLANLIFWIVRFIQAPGWDYGALVVLAISLIILMLVARLFSLRCQDRLIRLEERLRYAQVLPEDLASRASDLRVGQIIALRFASDAELQDLVEKVLDGQLQTQKEIKLAVKNWRGDYFRV